MDSGLTQNKYRTSVSSYYRHLAGHEQKPAQWDWERVKMIGAWLRISSNADQSAN